MKTNLFIKKGIFPGLLILTALLVCSCDQKTTNEKILEDWRLVSAIPASEETPLCSAIRQNAPIEVIKAFLDKGASPNPFMLKDGMSPLMLAVQNGNKEAATLLLEKGANVNLKNMTEGYSPLHVAVESKNPEMVKLLIDAGADIRFPMERYSFEINVGGEEQLVEFKHETPLMQAVRIKCPEVVEVLYDAGGGKLLEDYMQSKNPPYEKYNAFGWACDQWSSEMKALEIFLNKGVSIDTPCDIEGNTGLMLAAMNLYLEKVDYFLEKGADKIRKNKEGKTSLDVMEKVTKELEDKLSKTSDGDAFYSSGKWIRKKDQLEEQLGKCKKITEKLKAS